MDKDTQTNFIFLYKLEPEILCTKFRFESKTYTPKEIPSPTMLSFSVWQDLLSIFYMRVSAPFDAISQPIEDVASAIVSAYVFHSLKPLQYARTNWIEFKGSFEKIVVGKANALTPPAEDDVSNNAFRETDLLMPMLLNNRPLMRAFNDFRACLIAFPFDDVNFYAFRAIEDVRSYFEDPNDGEDRKLSWNRMNTALNRQKGEYDTLNGLAKNSRHGRSLESTTDEKAARNSIKFTRSIMKDFISYLHKQAQ